MVNSILNPNINYPELKKLDSEDKSFDASMYEINILGEDIIIALGQAKYAFIDDNIIYYPIYLVKDDKVSKQIGVYEILSEQLPNIVDEDGDIDLTQIDEPLLYKFVTRELLVGDKKTSTKKGKTMTVKDNDEDKDKDKDKDKDEDKDLYEPSADKDEPSADKDEPSADLDEPSADKDEPSADSDQESETILPLQTSDEMEKESKEYILEKGQPWVQEFLKSNSYQLVDNEGDGDCLFAVIRDAFKSVDKDISVMELRRKLSDEVTSELYENYKEKYKMFVSAVQDGESAMKELSKLNNELRDRLRNSKERDEQLKIVENAKEVATKYKLMKSETKISKELMTEFKFMKKVHSVEDLKKVIKTCEFWADTWSISTLERVLNVKLVIFSSEAWKAGDKNNVLQCGQLNDPILEDIGTFEPAYYILLDYTGVHYKLITYKHHRIFTFKQVPYAIKLDVAKNCLQGTSGPYKIIPQFKLFNDELGIDEPIELDVDVIKEKENTLYDNSIVFQFYNKSNDKPLPGKGSGEKIPIERIKEFSQLADINEWRRKLDNEYVALFELDGHKWKTVEHYYQANKFKNTNPDFYLYFSLDSGSKISEDVELARVAGSKTGKHKGEILRSKDIKIDPSFYGGNEETLLENGIYAKFSQDKTDLKQALLQTKKAKLQHYKKGMEPEIANSLMLVRSRLSIE
jgi:predicted NAD-dependent protein-ADP-ribosyltransferase YbiA (DUF1768 family)